MTAPQESYHSAPEQRPGTVEETAVKPFDYEHSASGLIDNLLSDLALIQVTKPPEVFYNEKEHVAALILDSIDGGSFNIVPTDKFNFRREYVDVFINTRLALFSEEERRLAHQQILEYEALRKQGLATAPAPRTDVHPSDEIAVVEIDYSESDKDVTTGEKFMRIMSRFSQKTLEIIGITPPAAEPVDNTIVIKQLINK